MSETKSVKPVPGKSAVRKLMEIEDARKKAAGIVTREPIVRRVERDGGAVAVETRDLLSEVITIPEHDAFVVDVDIDKLLARRPLGQTKYQAYFEVEWVDGRLVVLE